METIVSSIRRAEEYKTNSLCSSRWTNIKQRQETTEKRPDFFDQPDGNNKSE